MYTKYRKHFLDAFKKSDVFYATFPHHVEIVTHWAEKLCDTHPEADRKAVIIAALFHDIGHFINVNGEDHAVVSEREAIKFLKKEGESDELINKVAHAVRAHRNSDVKPQTIEAKILTFSDSASHITAPDVYLYLAAGKYGKKSALEKIERDYRDLLLFPEEKKKLEGIYVAWKDVVNTFPEDFYPYIRKNEERSKNHNK